MYICGAGMGLECTISLHVHLDHGNSTCKELRLAHAWRYGWERGNSITMVCVLLSGLNVSFSCMTPYEADQSSCRVVESCYINPDRTWCAS